MSNHLYRLSDDPEQRRIEIRERYKETRENVRKKIWQNQEAIRLRAENLMNRWIIKGEIDPDEAMAVARDSRNLIEEIQREEYPEEFFKTSGRRKSLTRCPHCARQYASRTGLDGHLRRMHPEHAPKKS